MPSENAEGIPVNRGCSRGEMAGSLVDRNQLLNLVTQIHK